MSSMQEKVERMQRLHAQEQQRQAMARTIDDIPFTYELISDDWLTATVCRHVAGAKVIAHTLDAADEGTSNRRRIFLSYNDAGNAAGLPRSVFCKATQSLESRFMLGLNDVAESEVHFYNHIRPLLAIEAPVGVFANIDRDSLNSIVMMRDMQGQAEFCDHRSVITRARADSQMRLLARIHGPFYSRPEMKTLIEPFQTFELFFEKTEAAIRWSEGRIRGLHAGKAVIPPRLYARVDEIDPLTFKAFLSHADMPRTLLHSDVHLKNWYIAANGEMGLADWQVLTQGNGTRDLAYTIATSLTTENRRAWEMDLIRLYLACLQAEGASPMTFEETLRRYRQQLFSALAMWTLTLTPPAGAPAMQPQETSLTFIDRITHAIDDLDGLKSFS
jgi:thiamine kinase-like enzyme